MGAQASGCVESISGTAAYGLAEPELAVLPRQVVDTTATTATTAATVAVAVAAVTVMRLQRTLIGDCVGLPGQVCG